MAPTVDRGVRLCYGMFLLIQGRKVFYSIGDHAVADLPVRRFYEAELIHSAIGAQRGDQTDVGPFRRLDRTDSAVVSRMDIANFESRPFSSKASRAQSAESPLVGDL